MSHYFVPQVTKDLAERKLTIVKDFRAPLPKVWAAWTNADQLSRWWGPKEWPATSTHFDFREGGHWHFCLTGPGGVTHWGLLNYTRIDEMKVLHAEDYVSDEAGAKVSPERLSRWEVTFHKNSSSTRVVTTLVCSSQDHLEAILRQGFESGYASALDNLTEALTGRSAPQTATAKDGTSLVYERLGSGSPVVLVGGAMVTRDNPAHTDLAAALSAQHTVFNYDRRGRGDSGDQTSYSVESEVDDLATMLSLAGGSAAVYGLSSGAILALKAAARGLPITKLILWEPPFVVAPGDRRPPTNSLETVTQLITRGRRAAAVTFFLTQVFGMPSFVPWLMRLSPYWKPMLAVARTLPYDLAIAGDFSIPAEVASVTVPTLVLHGDQTQALLIHGAQALVRSVPGATLQVLPGVNHQVAVKDLAPAVLAFL